MKAFVPELLNLPNRKMITVTTVGDPTILGESGAFKALYGAAYHAKMKIYKPKGVKMELGKLTALWPDAHQKPKNEWTGIWGVPVPDYVKEEDIIQKDPNFEVKLEVWPGGEYAQILHLGTYAEEGPTVQSSINILKNKALR